MILQKIVNLVSSSNGYAISIFGTTSISGNGDNSYCLLSFSINLRVFSFILSHLISLLFKNILKMLLVQFIFKKPKKIEICLVPKIQRGNILQTGFQLRKDLSQFEKSQQVYISGKEGDSISRSTMSNKPPFHCKRNWRLEASCTCQLYTEWIQGTVAHFGTLSNAVRCIEDLIIEKQLVQKKFFTLMCTFRAMISKELSEKNIKNNQNWHRTLANYQWCSSKCFKKCRKNYLQMFLTKFK